MHLGSSLSNSLSEALGTSGAVDDRLDDSWDGGVLGLAGVGVGGGDWDVVGDEGVGGGVVDTDDELHDLHGGEGLLDGFWDADAEGGYGIVGVL